MPKLQNRDQRPRAQGTSYQGIIFLSSDKKIPVR